MNFMVAQNRSSYCTFVCHMQIYVSFNIKLQQKLICFLNCNNMKSIPSEPVPNTKILHARFVIIIMERRISAVIHWVGHCSNKVQNPWSSCIC